MSSSNIRNGEVEIYEFSRGFSEVFENGKWISGGFGDAIDRSNYDSEIPAAIQKFINNNQNVFGIPTGFAPATNEVALIARVIDDSYCVLAVANYQGKDNKGRDGVVGYRYFWLDKNSEINQRLSSMDGIGTLLNWFLKKKFVFHMNPDSFTGEKLNCDEYYLSSDNINDEYQQDYPIYPSILTLADYNEDDRLELHIQAAEAAEKLGLPLAWAWNVSKLHFPEMYVAIWCEDEAAKQTIERELSIKGISKVDTLATPVQKKIIKRTDREHLTGDEKSIEIKLDEFVSDNSADNDGNRSEKARAIVEILCNDEDLDWSRFFVPENQHIKHLEKDEDPPIEPVRYYALLPLLIPEKIIEWLNWLQEPSNQKHTKTSFEIQRFICKACKDKQKEFVLQRIYDGISFLFFELVYGSNTNTYENCKWLFLSQRDNVWSRYLNDYAVNMIKFLERKASNVHTKEVFGGQITQELCDELSNDILNYKQPFVNNFWVKSVGWGVNTRNSGFSHLAKLLHQRVKTQINAVKYILSQYEKPLLDINLLSAICYQYTEGSIPSSVCWKLSKDYKKKIHLILKVIPQERGQYLRISKNSLFLGILTLGIIILLVQYFPKLSTYLFQDWPGSSHLSLEESIAKCNKIELDTTKSSDAKQQLQRCKIDLSKLLDNEIKTINQLQNTETPEQEKERLRNSKTYLYVNKKFPLKSSVSNSSISLKQLQKETDTNVLLILGYLKKSLDQEKTYSQIFKDLEKCLKKDKFQDFRTCIQKP